MEIKAKGKLDLNSVKALVHMSMFKNASPQKRLALWSVVFAILVIIIAIEMIMFGADSFLFILLGVNILWLALVYFWYFIIPRIKYNSLASMKDVENEYVFCDDSLKVFTKNQEYSGETEMKYAMFVRVYETTKYWFLYQTNNQAFIVDKATVEADDIECIRSKLSHFAADRYIICKY